MSDASPDEQVRRLYEEAEGRTAEAMEQLVGGHGFGELLARTTENVVALTRIGADVGDLVLRNLRIVGRSDITRLARQLGRTEDKLERVLQEVEALRDELREQHVAGSRPAAKDERRAGAGSLAATEPVPPGRGTRRSGR